MLRRIRNWLMKNYPLNHPVRISWVTDKVLIDVHHTTCFGDWSFDGKKHQIRLSKALKEYEIGSTLCHEWAHAVCSYIPQSVIRGDHDEFFALVHTRILNHYLGQE